jgi:hypothetical protein
MVLLWRDIPEGHRVTPDFLATVERPKRWPPVKIRRCLDQYVGGVSQCVAALGWMVNPDARRWYTYPPDARFVFGHHSDRFGFVASGVKVFSRCPERTAPGADLCPNHGGPRIIRPRPRRFSQEDGWVNAWWQATAGQKT